MRGAVRQDFVQVLEPVLDPLDRRCLADLFAAATQRIDLVAEGLDAPRGLDQRFGEGLAAAALADEVDEVREPALLGGELCLLQLQRVGEFGSKLWISSSTRGRT